MGCSNVRPAPPPEQKVGKEQSIANKSELSINVGDMVGEKHGQISRDYTLLNPALGKGAYGEVRKAIHKQTQLYRAVKLINKANFPKEEVEKLKNEVEILKTLDHPNIIKVFQFYQDIKCFYIVTELCTGGELFDKIIDEQSFSEKKAAEALKQILQAVNYLHKNKIVHRDLKPQNVLYESDQPGALLKVVDFGTSATFTEGQVMKQKLGTAYYIAPEVLSQKYDEKCDIWSIGVMLYVMLAGYPPFDGQSQNIILEKVKVGKYSFDTDEWTYISDQAQEFIRKCLVQDPQNRYSAEQAIQDEWIVKYTNQNDVDLPSLVRSLNNMKSFRAQKKIQEATMMFLVNYMASKEEKQELLQVFQSLDTNADGKLSKEELFSGYMKMFDNDEKRAEEEVENVFQMVDQNNSGNIDYTEWVMATINQQQLLSKQRLQATFKMFDKDGSGTLTLDEIRDIFGGTGAVDDSVWNEIIKQIDQNGDGQISYVQFQEMMLGLLDNEKKDGEKVEKKKKIKTSSSTKKKKVPQTQTESHMADQ